MQPAQLHLLGNFGHLCDGRIKELLFHSFKVGIYERTENSDLGNDHYSYFSAWRDKQCIFLNQINISICRSSNPEF